MPCIISYFQGGYSFSEHIQNFHHSSSEMKKLLKHTLQQCLQPRLQHQPTRHVYYRHQHFGAFEDLIQTKTPFHTNLIRDPVDHYISWYYYRRYGRFGFALVPLAYKQEFFKTNHSKTLQNMTFDECVNHNHKECTDPALTFTIIPYFCGYNDYCLEPSKKSLQQAKENVIKYFPVVGYVEKLTMYLELSEVIWPQYFTGAVSVLPNITKHGVSKERKKYEPSVLTKEKMTKHLQFEYKFYNWIKHRFHCMYDFYVKNKKNT